MSGEGPFLSLPAVWICPKCEALADESGCQICRISAVQLPVLASEPEDAVNHPKHYTSHPSGVECIQITRHMGSNLGNVMKYIWRADLKGNAIQDLEKAAFYLADEIAKRKGEIKS